MYKVLVVDPDVSLMWYY